MHFHDQAALSFTGLLRQAAAAGLAPTAGNTAPRGAPSRHETGQRSAPPSGTVRSLRQRSRWHHQQNVGDRRAPLLTELIEEPAESGALAPWGSPSSICRRSELPRLQPEPDPSNSTLARSLHFEIIARCNSRNGSQPAPPSSLRASCSLSRMGVAYHPERVSTEFVRRIAKWDLQRITLHGLRHTWATLALRGGVHPKVVQERLGHSTIGITLNTYSHVSVGMQREAAETVAKLIFGA